MLNIDYLNVFVKIKLIMQFIGYLINEFFKNKSYNSLCINTNYKTDSSE